RHVTERDDVVAWHDERVAREQRPLVEERDRLLGLGHDVRRQLTGDDRAEDAVLLHSSLATRRDTRLAHARSPATRATGRAVAAVSRGRASAPSPGGGSSTPLPRADGTRVSPQ